MNRSGRKEGRGASSSNFNLVECAWTCAPVFFRGLAPASHQLHSLMSHELDAQPPRPPPQPDDAPLDAQQQLTADSVHSAPASRDADDPKNAIPRKKVAGEDNGGGPVDIEYSLRPAASSVAAGTYPFAVRLRGLPWNTTVDDVGLFIMGSKLSEERVIFVHNAAGDAFARMTSETETSSAVNKNGARMGPGQKMVEVYESSGEEADAWATRCATRPTGSYRGVVKLKGLPYSATEADVVAFFGGFLEEASRVHILLSPDGRASGEAYAEFESLRRARDAIARFDRRELGGRWIDLTETCRGELYSAQHASANALRRTERTSTEDDPLLSGIAGLGIVRVRGLLYEATRADVARFFADYKGVNEASIFMAPRLGDGRPSGEAFVCFATPEEAAHARDDKNGKELGGRWLELSIATAAELGQRCKASLRAAARPDALDAGIVRLRGLPFQATLADVERLVAAASDASRGAFRLRSPVEFAVYLTADDSRRPTGEAFAIVEGEAGQANDAARGLDGATLGDRLVAAAPAAKADLYAALGSDALTSHCVALKGLPYHVTDPSHLQNTFFPTLDLDHAFICRDKNGAAYVKFRNLDHALLALARNRADLDGRFVEVFPCASQEFDKLLNSNSTQFAPPQTNKPVHAPPPPRHFPPHHRPNHHHHHNPYPSRGQRGGNSMLDFPYKQPGPAGAHGHGGPYGPSPSHYPTHSRRPDYPQRR